MSYFENVYLLRLNRYVTTPQSRILGKMEHNFYRFLEKSPNTVDIYKGNKITKGVMQTEISKNDVQKNLLLTPRSYVLNPGAVIYSFNRLTGQAEYWLVLHRFNYETIGYNKYNVLLLTREVEWIDQNSLYHKQKAYFIGPKDDFVSEKFKMISGNTAFITPAKHISMVTVDNEGYGRGIKLTIGKGVYKIVELDRDSIPGLAYISLEETFSTEEDFPLADSEKLGNWTFTSSLGDSIKLLPNDIKEVTFKAFYNGIESNEPISVSINGNLVSYSENSFITGEDEGLTSCAAALLGSPTISQIFPIEVAAASSVSIAGPSSIKMGKTYRFELSCSEPFTFELDKFSLDNLNVRLEKIEEENDKVFLLVTPLNIGTVIISFQDEVFFCEKEVTVLSFWM